MHDSSPAYLLPGPLALSRATADRVAHRRTDAAWLEAAWRDPGTRVLTVGGGSFPVLGGDLRFVSPEDAPTGERYLLGVDDGVAYFAVDTGAKPDDGSSLREAGPVLGDRDAGLAVHAVALANWHAQHRHCARCGAVTEVRAAGHVRRCPQDGSEHYPRTDPAVIVLVLDQADRCLLGRGAAWPERRFSTLAGFVEPGETPEHAVAREVFEESGVQVDSCRYAGAQPWPFPSSLMLGYYATGRGSPRPDGDEIVEAQWFSRDELRDAALGGDIVLPGGVSIARRLVEGWYGAELPGPPRD
nr:NAD(+) diphosphatase [Haloactinopolyspora alba]